MKKIMMATMATVALSAGTCESMYRLAEVVMSQRQNGASVVVMMQKAKEAGVLAPMMKTMITRAYETPQYETGEFKRSAIKEFAEMYYLGCIEAGLDSNESKN